MANIRLKNSISQPLTVTLKKSGQPVETVTIPGRSALPSIARPQSIDESDLTAYTQNLVAAKHLRVTPA